MKRTFKASLLRDRAAILHRIVTSDGGGGQTGVWETRLERRCAIISSTSFRYDVERVLAGGLDSMPIVQIVFRRDSEMMQVTTRMRVRDRDTDRTYKLNTIGQPIFGDERWLSFSATLNQPS